MQRTLLCVNLDLTPWTGRKKQMQEKKPRRGIQSVEIAFRILNVLQQSRRQAMAHLEDQQGWIQAFMHGAGAPAYGPIPAYPKSPYLPANAATNPYPFSISTAANLLKSHGWTINASYLWERCRSQTESSAKL